jgi:phage terminase small subunit
MSGNQSAISKIFTAKPPRAPSWLNKDAKPIFLAILENIWRSPRLGG